MNLYEVAFWGSNGNGNAIDTLYLVRAPDYRSAFLWVEADVLAKDRDGVKKNHGRRRF